ncbi:peptidase S24/S26A/S26B/S26C [Apodospora peruviana]|uniref:Mitochondrial inner membrane protease subunit 2 n=1 Tax=Apodospora peruviana TaxID=516989 RepID=A0AAE0I508_9PEZI|nr:peptidase S24/S26A/S26B/S26C [Apodospora peruviana]
MARWGSAGTQARSFLGQFTHHLIRYATWLPPLICVKEYVADLTFINGPSMYPFLNPHYNESLRRDLCLTYKRYSWKNLKRGMIVIFRSPENPKTTQVKRIVALEGDRVRTRPPYPYEYVNVPEGHVWVEGDGENTKDSNYYGPISAHLITGRITHILLPWDRAGRVRWWEHPERPGLHKGLF